MFLHPLNFVHHANAVKIRHIQINNHELIGLLAACNELFPESCDAFVPIHGFVSPLWNVFYLGTETLNGHDVEHVVINDQILVAWTVLLYFGHSFLLVVHLVHQSINLVIDGIIVAVFNAGIPLNGF